MDQALEAISSIINDLGENTLDFDRHVRQIQTAASSEGMETEVLSTMELISTFYAVPDDVWLPLIAAKESSVDKKTASGLIELLTLYEKAEADYLSA